MRRTRNLLVATMFAASLPVAAAEDASGLIRVGDPAPDFTLDTLAGDEYTLSEAAGAGPVVLVLYRGVW